MDYIIKHGPHKGKTFYEVDPVELEKYTQEQINEFLRLVEENEEFGKSADYVYNNLLWERENKALADEPEEQPLIDMPVTGTIKVKFRRSTPLEPIFPEDDEGNL